MTQTIQGSGDPRDIELLTRYIEAGEDVILQGEFDFSRSSSITVKTSLSIVGDNAAIIDGDTPFIVDAPGGTVTIENLLFKGTISKALDLVSADKIVVANCQITGVAAVNTNLGTQTNPIIFPIATGMVVHAENHMADIHDNVVDVGGSANEFTIGIFGVGPSGASGKADFSVYRNTVRNVTRHGIDLRYINGRSVVMWNDVDMGHVASQPPSLIGKVDLFVNGIRCLGSGDYFIAENKVACNFENAAGIRLQGNYDAVKGKVFPIQRAVVVGNDVIMNPTPQMFGPDNAAIELRRAVRNSCIVENRLQGQSRSGVSLVAEASAGGTLMPTGNTLVLPDDDGRLKSDAFVAVGKKVTDTLIRANLNVVDDGSGTLIFPRIN